MTQCDASGSFSRVKRTKKDDSWSTWLLGTNRCHKALAHQHSNTSMKTPTLRFKDNFQRYTAQIWARSIFRKRMDRWQVGCQHFETPWNKASRTAGEKWTDSYRAHRHNKNYCAKNRSQWLDTTLPSIVYVLPVPVCPYAKIVPLKPSSTDVTRALTVSSYISSWQELKECKQQHQFHFHLTFWRLTMTTVVVPHR